MKVGDSENDAASVILRIKSQITPMSPTTATVLHHWMDLVSREACIPDRQAISPEAMASALAHVWLCDFDSKTDRFRYRLGGEHVTSNLGSGVRGRYLDELTAPDIYPRVHAYFRKCVDLPAVLHVSGRIYAEQSRVALGERIMVPYCDEAGVVAGILGATFRKWSDQEPSPDPESPTNSRRHVYYRLSDGAAEAEDITLP